MPRLLLPLVLVLLLAGCARGDGRAACPAGMRCLEIGNNSEAQSLDPAKAQIVAESHILYDMMVGLTTYDAHGNTIPGMATSWRTSPDGLTWTFRLRDARWSDGAPVTAGDFVFAFRRLEDPLTASPYAWLMYVLAGAEAANKGEAPVERIGARAIGDHALELRLTHPTPYLPLLLVHSSAMPVPEHVVRRLGDAWVRPGNYVSNGPYVLKSWLLNDRLVLERNPRFYDPAPICFDRVSYRPVSDAIAAERGIESGEIDITDSFASNRAEHLRARMPAFVHANPILATGYLPLNERHPALADRRVRLALSIAVDRDFIARRLLRSGQTPAYGFVPPGIANYPGLPRPAWAGWPLERRRQVARALLARAGYDDRRPLALELKYGTNSERLIPPALQADWRAIGVTLSLTPEDGQILYADLNARNFDVALASWYTDFDDAISFLRILSSEGGQQNYGRYHDPRYDGLIAASDDEPDLGRRAALLARAETVAMADAAIVPLYVISSRNLVNPTLGGWYETGADYHPKRFVCRR